MSVTVNNNTPILGLSSPGRLNSTKTNVRIIYQLKKKGD